MPEPSGCLALVGPMGSGKSTVGATLAARTGRPFVDVDAVVEARLGTTIAELFAAEGEAAFRDLERRALAEVLDGGAVVATGGGAVLDDGSRRLLAERATVIWLTTSAEVLVDRIGDPAGRPLLVGGDPLGAMRSILADREALYAAVADLRVEVGERSPDEVADEILTRLGVAA